MLQFENRHMECLGPKEYWKSSAMRWRQNSCSDVDNCTSFSRLFQTAGVARSMIVERWVWRRVSADVIAERQVATTKDGERYYYYYY